MGGALGAVGGGAFVLLDEPLALVDGEGYEASWMGRILLGVLPLDCGAPLGESSFDGEEVPFSSTLTTFFSNTIFFAGSFNLSDVSLTSFCPSESRLEGS